MRVGGVREGYCSKVWPEKRVTEAEEAHQEKENNQDKEFTRKTREEKVSRKKMPLLSNYAQGLSGRRNRKWPLWCGMLFKRCSYIVEIDTEIFKDDIMSGVCFKIL